MNTLRQFSEKEKNYFAYQVRQDFIRQQNSILLDSERKVEKERIEKEAAIQQALAKIEELEALLKNQSS
jgi:hypothetical protein